MAQVEAAEGKAEEEESSVAPKVVLELDQVMNFARQVMHFAYLIQTNDLKRLVDEIERTDTLMPILDPTQWMRIRHNIPAHKKLARALLTFRREIDEIVEMEAKLHARV